MIRIPNSGKASMEQIVRNKAKEQISKLVFQENKARQIFQKTSISCPLIHTFQGLRNIHFLENLTSFVTDEIQESKEIIKSKRTALWKSQLEIQVGNLTIWVGSTEMEKL